MTHIQQRRDTAATWASINPILYIGEAGHETDTGKWKMGDGLTPWNSLPYKGGVDSVSGKTGVVALDVADVAGAAPLASPVFTGTPAAPTPPTTDNDTSIATTAFVKAVVAALVNASPAALDTLNELAAALGNDPNFATTVTNALATKAPLDSPALIGNPTAPTPAAADEDTSIATTAFTHAAISSRFLSAGMAVTTSSTGTDVSAVRVFRRPGLALVNVSITAPTAGLVSGARLFYMPSDCFPPVTIFGDLLDTVGDLPARFSVSTTGDVFVQRDIAGDRILRGQFFVPLTS